jgi:hypothetical protein
MSALGLVPSLGDAGTKQVRDLDQLLGGVQRPGAGENGDPLAGIEDLGGGGEVGVVRQRRANRGADAGVDGAVLARRDLHRVEHLDVIGHDDAGHRALVEGDPHGPVHYMADLVRHRDRLHVLRRHVLEQAVQVDLLLIVAAERAAGLLADDGHHRLMVRLCVVEPVQQVDGAGAGGCHAHAHLAGELGMAASHERGQLLMARLDELHLVAGPVERAQQPVDAVARIAEDPSHAPLPQPLEEVVAGGLRHSQ